MKVVLDTNVLVAAFATEGMCHSLLEFCVDRHQVVVSSFVLKELSEGLLKKLKMPSPIVEGILDYLNDMCITVDPKPLERPICRDHKDDAILALASVSVADYLITGDDDLLVLKKLNTTLIVTPREFWEISRK